MSAESNGAGSNNVCCPAYIPRDINARVGISQLRELAEGLIEIG